jgi:arginine decarboxylase
LVPKKLFLTAGSGVHKYRLHSFELALRDAGIERCNLVKVSSIMPPCCEIIPKEKGVSLLKSGQITYCVLSVHRTQRERESIGSSIGLAIPSFPDSYGYIAEFHEVNISSDELKRQVEELARTMLTTTKGVPPLISTSAYENNSVGTMGSSDCTVRSICQHYYQTQAGVWTTVLTAAVFLEG